MFASASHTSPDRAVLMAMAGILLIYLELNRPGLVIPGAVGLLAVLLSVDAITRFHVSATGLVLILASIAMQLLTLRKRSSWVLAILAGSGVVAGLHLLLVPAQGPEIHFPEAFSAGVLLGPGTSLLTAVARRARTSKGLDL